MSLFTCHLFSILLFCLDYGQLVHAKSECQPVTWGERDPQAVEVPSKLPPMPNQAAEFGDDWPQQGDLVCEFWFPTGEDVNQYTCREFADKIDLTINEFLFLNPTLKPDCSNIKPYTWYCMDGFKEPLRAWDGKCGPHHKNATCSGTGKSCCNSKTWTCGNRDSDCYPGICYEGACPGHRVYTTDGTCGPENGNRGCAGVWGDCCNLDGKCGSGESFCGAQVCTFGDCNRTQTGPPALPGPNLPWNFGNSTDGTCGGTNGYTCDVVSGNCCNKDGRCGSLPSDCGQGCQPLYVKCHDKKLPSSAVVLQTFEQDLKGWNVIDGSFNAKDGKLFVGDSAIGKAVYNASFDDFILQADISLTKEGDGYAGLIFRSTQLDYGLDTYSGYLVGISTVGLVTLARVDDDGWTSLGTSSMAIAANEVYRVKVQAIGDLITVYVQDMANPKITAKDRACQQGIVGVWNIWTGAEVANFAVSLAFGDDFRSDLSNWKIYDGKFEATNSGLIASDTVRGKAVYVYTVQDFVLEANLTLPDANGGTAGFIFRASELATRYQGYYAGVGTDGTVVLGRADGNLKYLASAKTEIIASQALAVKIRAVSDLIEVYVDDLDIPKISFRDSAFASGLAGVRIFRTKAQYNAFKIQPIILNKFEDKNRPSLKTVDGEFQSGGGELIANNTGSGKAIYDTTVKDVILECDITMIDGGGDAGLIFRANDVATGGDAYKGYFAGINSGGWLVLGFADDGRWTSLQSVKVSIDLNKKYHIKVKAIGSLIQVHLDDMVNAKINIRDTKSSLGVVGFRVYNAGAKYGNYLIQHL